MDNMDRIAALEAEVARLKKFENTILSKDHTHRYTLGGVTGLEEQIETLKFVCAEHSAEIIRLQSHDKEAMELLEAAVTDAEYLAYLVKDVGEKCNNCYKSDKSCFQSSDCWKWQHDDRYEALKAQSTAMQEKETANAPNWRRGLYEQDCMGKCTSF